MMGMNKRGSTSNPEQMVFTNSFALESMIQACNAAKDEKAIANAINRLKSFVGANKLVLDMKQQKKLADVMAVKKKNAEIWTATITNLMTALNVVLEENAAESRGRKHTAVSGSLAVGESPEEIRNSPVTAFDTILPGRKVFLRIDREHGVVYTTYRLFLEGVTPDLEEDETFGTSRETFLLAAQKQKMTRTANYHIWDNITMSGKYIGKVRRHGKMFDAGKKFIIYDDGKTALSDRNMFRQAGHKAAKGAAAAPGALGSAAYKAPGATAKAASATAKATSKAASATASASKKGYANAKEGAKNAKTAYDHKYREKDDKGTLIAIDGVEQPIEETEAPEPPAEEETPAPVSTGPMQSGEGDIFADKQFRGDDDGEDEGNVRQEVGALLFREEDNLNMVHLLCSHTGKPVNGKILDAWEADKNSVFHLSNKHPVWNEDSKMWSLGFEGVGRVVLASSKNFVMQGEDGKTHMQFGKQGANSFTLDIRSPITPFLAFSYAMAFFEL